MIKVHILPCGSTTVDKALPFRSKSKNPLAFTGILRGKKNKISVPVVSYLIESPKGLILVDTGWDRTIRDHARKYEGLLNHFVSPGFLPMGEGVHEQLAKRGIKPNDLLYVILTHLDIDHAGGLQEVKEAKNIMVSEKEWEAAHKANPRYRKALWRDIPVKTFPNEKTDLLGDGSITLLPLPGHSPGLVGVKVGKDDDFLIIGGDVGYGAASYQKMDLPGLMWNKKEAIKSLREIKDFSENPNCQAILLTHNRDVEKLDYLIKEE